MRRVMYFIRQETCVQNRSETISKQYVFCGSRNKGCLKKILMDEVRQQEMRDAIFNLFVGRYGQLCGSLPCEIFNTARLQFSEDCRTNLRSTSSFHGHERYSTVQLKDIHHIHTRPCKYAKCMMFVEVGIENIAVVKMFPMALMDTDSEIGKFINDEYQFLENTVDDSNWLQLVPLKDIYRQEQLCFLENNKILVNHFVWSNVFTSTE